MFSTLPTPAHKQLQSHHYSPAVPSPLSSSPQRQTPSPLAVRDANTLHFDPMLSPSTRSSCSQSLSASRTSMASWGSENSKGSAGSPGSVSSRGSTYSKRATKPNPLMQRGNGEGRETRRKLFLKKVKEGAEEKRWMDRNRGGEDEIMRAVWVMEERRRGEARRKAAREEGFADIEDLEDLEGAREDADEEVVRMQERELDEMLQQYDSQRLGPPDEHMNGPQKGLDTPYGSDDEEYDDIFMDVIQKEIRMSSQQSSGSTQQMALPTQTQEQRSTHEFADQDMMDMS